jgi:hypothetical protein
MGPWSHGDWARNGAKAVIGNINFGDSISGFFQKNKLHLSVVFKRWKSQNKLPEAYVFDTGSKVENL